MNKRLRKKKGVGAITPNIAVVLRGEREADAALAGELAAMGLL